MFGFYVKKNFCDLWDNLFLVFVPGFLCSAAAWLCAFAILSLKIEGFPMVPALAVSSGIFFGMVFAFGRNAASLACWEVAPVKNFFAGIKGGFLAGFAFGLLCALIALVLVISIPYYLRLREKWGQAVFVLAGALFWFGIVCALALQWFLPLRSFMPDDGFFKTLKKCFIIFFDNALFSVAVFLHNCALFAFSAIIFSSPAAIALSLANALRLRLYKYDWLERQEDPQAARKEDVPWDELLAQDRETLGPRSLRSFLFPWVK